MDPFPTVQTPLAARAAAGLTGAADDIPMDDLAQAKYHLGSLSKEGTFIELRARVQNTMQSAFFQGTDFDEAAEAAVKVGAQTDVYVGVLPRVRQDGGGGKDNLLPGGHWMWVEADTETAVNRALNLPDPPPLVIRSSPGKAHCYWPLFGVTRWEHIEIGNRRLAWHIGADLRACDAARILRVAGTRNYKRGEPTRVSITRLDIASNIWPGELVGSLPDPAPPRPTPPPRAAAQNFGPDTEKDAILAVPSRVYVERLTGRDVYHNMTTCPFHNGGQERTPSFHVSGPNETLWHCFGCAEGGDVFRFAARLWGLDERTQFPDIKRRLKVVL